MKIDAARQHRLARAPTLGRILMVTSTFPRWPDDSVAPFCLNLALDLQNLGWTVDVLAPHAPGAARREILAGLTVERFRYAVPERRQDLCYDGGALVQLRRRPGKALWLPSFVAAESLAVARRLHRARYDIVHSHWILPQGFAAALGGTGSGVPHVVTAHGSDLFGLQGRVFRAFKRWSLGRADAVTANSSFTEAALAELTPEDLTVRRIPMGVTEAPPPAAATIQALRRTHRRGDGPLLVFVGRLIEEKGPEDAIEALARLALRWPDATLLLVGDGPQRASLEALSQARGVADRVAFLGWRDPDEIPAYLAAADVFVGPSKPVQRGGIEAQGLTFLEALQVGTPVVATRVGGIVDAVRHEETGLLVAPGAPGEIAEAVARLLDDPDLARRLGAAGADLVRAGFTRSQSAAAFSGLFQDLMSARAGRG